MHGDSKVVRWWGGLCHDLSGWQVFAALSLFFCSCGVFVFYAFTGWNGSLLEQYPFRQTQTAISAYYLLKGGSFLSYETPVLGAPWSIPMEFPFYQYVVYLFVRCTGTGLDQAGRVVSLGFFFSALYPVWELLKPFFPARNRTFIAVLLLLVSPLYVYWSRSFMIESAALALSLWYLLLIKITVEHDGTPAGKRVLLLLVPLVGAVASVTKVTTFSTYYAIGILLLSSEYVAGPSRVTLRQFLKQNCFLLVVAFIVPLVSIAGWTAYSDHVKALNPLGTGLTSFNLQRWNFGTLQQKMSVATWWSILTRAGADVLGDPRLVLLFALLPLCRFRTVVMSLLLGALFLLPMVIFTNLYYVHNYYFYANGVLLLAAVALVIGDISTRGTAGFAVSLALLVLIGISCVNRYGITYLPCQGSQSRFQDIKADLDVRTDPGDVLVFAGADWSSEMPYYLERRSLMLTQWRTDPASYRKARQLLKPYHVGSILVCNGARDDAASTRKLLQDFNFSDNVEKISYGKCDAYFP